MGLVLLIGLVVKNGIVLLDYAEREHERGIALAKRLRRGAGAAAAILMTTLCAVRAGSAGAGDRAEPNCGGRSRSPSSEGSRSRLRSRSSDSAMCALRSR